MSLFSRLLGRSPPAPVTPAAQEAAAPVEAPPRPDPVATAHEEEVSVSQAIAEGDMAAVGQWTIHGSSTRVRQMAARAVTDLDQLRDLIRATRGGNDKTVHRILSDTRDQLLAEIRGAERQRADLEAAAAAIAQHSARSYDSMYEATLGHLAARWEKLEAHATAEARHAVALQLEHAHDVVRQHRRAVEAETERKHAAGLAALEAQRRRDIEAQAAASAAAEQARILEVERQAAQAKRRADEAEARSILGTLRQAQAAIDHGGTARAARLRDDVREKLAQAPALPPWFTRKLEELDSRIEEMKDWKIFTVVPKRAGLIERMQSLVGADIQPEELARQIRRLRDEWRTLNRGASEDPSPEWQRFDEAANRAYAPCREHFARQAALRRQNQLHREALLDRLASFAAEQVAEPVNWRAVQQTLFEARREWRQYAPVDQTAVKPLQERFHALLDVLQGPLDAEYARNIETKRELIARTASLVKLDDSRQAIEEAKRLQRTWKSVGLVPRHQDNALWEEFRRHCDAIFERSAQESAACAAGLEANQARAVSLCGELERIAEFDGEALASGLQRLPEMRAEFEALALPRASLRDLHRRFARAGERCNEAMHRHRAAAARQAWADLFMAAAQVREYALATVRQRPAAECEALQASAATAVAGLGQTPKGARARLEQHVANVAAGEFSDDLAANEKALRLLCVRAELVAAVASPEEDLDLRREYQMQRLVASMGRGERAAPTELDDLALEWIAVGPVEAAAYDALHARFEHCRKR